MPRHRDGVFGFAGATIAGGPGDRPGWPAPFECGSSLGLATDGEDIVLAAVLPAWDRTDERHGVRETRGPWFIRVLTMPATNPDPAAAIRVDIRGSILGRETGYFQVVRTMYSRGQTVLASPYFGGGFDVIHPGAGS